MVPECLAGCLRAGSDPQLLANTLAFLKPLPLWPGTFEDKDNWNYVVNEEHESEAQPERGPAIDGESAEADVDTVAADGADEGDEDPAAQIAKLSGEVERLKEDVLRAHAEAENVRKRAERDVQAAHKFGVERFVQDLLPVKDSIDLGLGAVNSASDIEGVREGMELTAKMFSDFLEKAHVVEIDPAGERFDPEFHQAMSTEPSSEHPAGTVLRVMQKGYQLNERLVRPALVIVARADEEG